MMRSALVQEGRFAETPAEQTSHLFQGHFQALVPGYLLAVWHLFLVGILILAVVFWVFLGCWIIVRLARTAKK